LESEIIVGPTAEIAFQLWRPEEKDPLLQTRVEGPRNELLRLMGQTVIETAKALAVPCPDSLTDYLTSHRTQSFGAFVNFAEGLASQVDTVRLEKLQRAASDDPQWAAAQIGLAVERHRAGDHGALVAVVTQLAESGARAWDWISLAAAANALGEKDMAGRALKQALACDQASGETDLARALSARLA
jgi:hypothetical protein